jgi:GNAT superfamily N-acetyltransferase
MKNQSTVTVTLLKEDDWQRLRDLRLRSLKENPDAFGGVFEIEELKTQAEWRSKFENLVFLASSIGGADVGLMSVEVLDGDHGATCWVGGCWTDPKFRGQGALRALFDFLDVHSKEYGWQRQGLGVWADNFPAIAAYEALGFAAIGERQPSDRQPGRFYLHMVRDSK